MNDQDLVNISLLNQIKNLRQKYRFLCWLKLIGVKKMIIANLQNLENYITKLQQSQEFFSKSLQLQKIYSDLMCLRLNIKDLLLHCTSSIQHENKEETQERLDFLESSQQSLKNEAEKEQIFQNHQFLLQEKQFLSETEEETLSIVEGIHIKLVESQTKEKKFKNLIEKISILIQNQNKIKEQLFLINCCKKKKDLSSKNNGLQIDRLTTLEKKNLQNICCFKSIKNIIEKALKNCKEIKKNYSTEVKPSEVQVCFESSSQDKKSLLTEILKQNQNIESQQNRDYSEICRKSEIQPMSVLKFNHSSKKLLKQIDFFNYKIDGNNHRKQKKPKPPKFGINCNPSCTIF